MVHSAERRVSFTPQPEQPSDLMAKEAAKPANQQRWNPTGPRMPSKTRRPESKGRWQAPNPNRGVSAAAVGRRRRLRETRRPSATEKNFDELPTEETFAPEAVAEVQATTTESAPEQYDAAREQELQMNLHGAELVKAILDETLEDRSYSYEEGEAVKAAISVIKQFRKNQAEAGNVISKNDAATMLINMYRDELNDYTSRVEKPLPVMEPMAAEQIESAQGYAPQLKAEGGTFSIPGEPFGSKWFIAAVTPEGDYVIGNAGYARDDYDEGIHISLNEMSSIIQQPRSGRHQRMGKYVVNRRGKKIGYMMNAKKFDTDFGSNIQQQLEAKQRSQ